MTQEIIDIGALPNDGEGDPLRTAFAKINFNFTELFTGYSNLTTNAITTGLTPNQVIFETPISTFTQARFQINSVSSASDDSQNIILSAASVNNGSNVKFTGFGTIFYGSPVTSYNMDVSSGNVRILASPLVDAIVYHFIGYQIQYTSTQTHDLYLELDGYPDAYMATENNLILTTES